ncbi:MAG: FkbM family methyltransferase, partial [Prosthecobacter sp.]|nr:FkbM family methyltransferase [Prosthecobacter sp.]
DCDHIPKVLGAGEVIEAENERVQIMHNGVRVLSDGYYGPWMTDIIKRLKGHHEPQEELVYHELMKLLSPTAKMIEIGGFWSYYSLWFLSLSAGRSAIVVEPDPENLKVGKANANLNNAAIEFVQASVGQDFAESIEFVTETSGRISIPTVSLPYLLDKFSIEVLDLLHCDAQGAETDVIASSQKIFSGGRVKFCVFSTHSHHITGDPLTHQRCLQMLQDFGARILIEHDVHESFSGDGLIAATFERTPLKWETPQISRNRYSTSLFRNPLFDLALELERVNQRAPNQKEP